jgi:hypothetical protein
METEDSEPSLQHLQFLFKHTLSIKFCSYIAISVLVSLPVNQTDLVTTTIINEEYNNFTLVTVNIQ